MTYIRQSKQVLFYIVLVCCGLLLTFVYMFHGNGLFFLTIPAQASDDTLWEQTIHINSPTTTSNTSVQTRSSNAPSDYSDETLSINQIEKTDTPVTVNDDDKLAETKRDSSLDYVRIGGYLATTLAKFLENKLNAVSLKKVKNFKPTCDTDFKRANSCDNNKCLQTELPENPEERVAQLVTPRHLQMSQEEHQILREMADKVEGNYDIILLTAASSNHFLESQALLKNLHENVYPFLRNFTLVFYDLGLTERERFLMVKYCRCQVVDFPFHKFPDFTKELKCYSWKPIMIKAHLQKTNIVFWMDASIRFTNYTSGLYHIIKTARERGLQIGGSSADSSIRTLRSMFHFFGDEPCAYLKLGQAHATLGVYHREYFVDRAVLEPWVACALREKCMCPRNRSTLGCRESKNMASSYYKGEGEIVYGLCHRYDQSAISLILHKLYQESYMWIMVNTESVLSIMRRHTMLYFPAE